MSARARGSLLLATLILAFPVAKAADNEPSYTTWSDYGSPPGDLRAFDVGTGRLVWTFHTIPRPGEYGYESWPELEALFFPQVDWLLDAIHERILPLDGHQPRTNHTLDELVRREKSGV